MRVLRASFKGGIPAPLKAPAPLTVDARLAKRNVIFFRYTALWATVAIVSLAFVTGFACEGKKDSQRRLRCLQGTGSGENGCD
jgi:hypothetical protein